MGDVELVRRPGEAAEPCGSLEGLDRHALVAAPAVAGAIRLELRRNRLIARALHRRDGWIPGPRSQAGAAHGWGEDACGRHRCGCSCLFVSWSKLERRSAGCRARS